MFNEPIKTYLRMQNSLTHISADHTRILMPQPA